MSDPMSTGEIEDVLSSIRRLVSEEAGPEGEAAARLVLTAAQRVDARSGSAPGEGAGMADETPADDEGGASGAKRPDAEGADTAGADTEASDGSEGDDKPALERELESLEAAVLGRDDAQGDRDYDPWEPAGDAAAFPHPEAEITDAELAGSERAGVSEAEVVMFASAARGRAKSASPDADENVGQPDIESLLDENELRALVAEVLREELKGPLGERITRNVRKLVRREIAQALSSMNID